MPQCKVASAGLVVTTVRGSNLPAQIGSHGTEGRITHRESEANVTDHRSHKIAVVTGSWTSVERSILLPNKGRGGGDDAFLPR